MPQRAFALCLTALLALATQTSADAPLLLANEGRSQAAVVAPQDAAPNVQEAAADLANVLSRMTGATFQTANRPGRRQAALVVGAREADSGLPPLAYHVLREGDRIYLSGGSDQGAVNAVYAFLRELGCRWYAPGPAGEVIPHRGTLEIGDLDLHDAPDYESINGFGGYPLPGEGRLWARRNLLEGFPPQYHDHNWDDIVPASRFEEHPEWFAFSGGVRTDQLCTTNPEVIAEAIRVAREYFDTHPDAVMFSLSPNDNDDFCQCDRCRALDDSLGVSATTSRTGTITPRLVHFANQVAEGLEESYPNKYLAFFAYNSHTDPPRTSPAQDADPGCLPYAVDLLRAPRHRRRAVRAQPRLRRDIAGWNSMASKVYIYTYYGHYHWYGPYGLVHNIRRDLPWLRRHGVVGLHSEAHDNWWTQGLNLILPSA